MTAEPGGLRPAVHRFAVDVSELELADYQRAVRLILRHPLITGTWPDERALPRVRRFAATLRRDLAEAFGYRLELHGSTARLVRAKDQLDGTQPAVSRTGRPFDRQRYAYLALCLAVLGRAGIQITLSELADSVVSDANRITGLGLDPDHGPDRRAFVDAVGWLEERGVLRLADGSSAAWASDPGAGEALYDVARDVVFALFRPTRVVQHVESVSALLGRTMTSSGNAERRQAARAARRAVVESPVVYHADVDPVVANHLRGSALAADLARLTGLRVERRAEGVLLVDTAGFTGERFPGTGSVAQAAVLLAVEMADRVVDPDGVGSSASSRPTGTAGSRRWWARSTLACPRPPWCGSTTPVRSSCGPPRTKSAPTRPMAPAGCRSSLTAFCVTPSARSCSGTGRRSVSSGTPTRTGCATRRWRCWNGSARSPSCRAECSCGRWSVVTATRSPQSSPAPPLKLSSDPREVDRDRATCRPPVRPHPGRDH
ncbi:TIGR02678 family protein [Micromonospora sp. ATA51]|uniref:TIGR02678 family protein n=1 Tax=Micromonospora sp. ATA51 TaxID=2806098 RepID=UPI001EE44FE0|nr:TIGR02678 family protein [Micromonospora sp. ATA51]